MNIDESMKKQRIRINVSTTAKGKAQFDITVEMLDEEPEAFRKLLTDSFAVAKETAKEAGFEPAE